MEKYIIKVLFIHRKETYSKQYAPEAVEIIDEWSEEDNLGYLENKKNEYLKQSDIVQATIINISLDREEIESKLYPKNEQIEGEIK